MTYMASTTGWWVCCQCSADINSFWYGGYCVECSHLKCSSYCTNISDDLSSTSGGNSGSGTLTSVPISGPVTTEATKAVGISADDAAPGAARSNIFEDTIKGFERREDTINSIKGSGQLEKAKSPARRLSRSSSLASISESIFSTASGSSKSSIRGFEGASEQLAWLLIEDSKLQPLWHEAAVTVPLDRLERNLTRLLKIFAAELKEEAVTVQERRLAQVVRAEAKHSAHLIGREIDANEELWESNQKLEESESDDRDDEPLNFKQLEKFLINSLAFEAFRKNLRQFVSPELQASVSKEETERELWSLLPFAELEPGDAVLDVWRDHKSLKSFSRSLVKARNKLFKCPPIAKGTKRITWTCPCGKAMYDDYEELERGAAKRFQRELRRMFSRQHLGNTIASTRTSFSLIASCSSVVSTLVEFGRVFHNKYLTRNSDLPTFELRPQGQLFSPTSEETLQTEHLYLLLCLCESRRVTTMRAHQPTVQSIESDKSLFRMLQAYYSETRRRWWSWLLLWDLQRIHFVHFEMYEKSLVDIRALHVIPPEDHSASYCYERSTLKPPIGSNLLMHFFHRPEDASAITPCFQKIPKKRKEKLSVCPVKGVSPGWGLCFHEGWSWRKILAWCFLMFVLVSIGVCVLYWKFEHNVQDAVTLGTFMLACFGIGVSTLQAWLIIK
ncbi:hypothetical protein B0O99DRAFT_618150 [Bisporella sp. PMI_857]|nr:hypothetical protein B0O99DRAFT_618150 [Bisporella sp. PMI_857]